MSDGSGGPKSGVFEFGSKAVKQVGGAVGQGAKTIKNDLTGQFFGSAKQNSPGGMPANFPKPGQKNPLAGMDLAQMFGEKGAGKNPFGPKPIPQVPQQPAISQEELAKMEEDRQVKIKAAQDELQQHKEVYFNEINDVGKNTQQKQQEKQNEEIKEENEKQDDLWQKQQKDQKDSQLQAALKGKLSTGEIGKSVSG